SISTSTSTSTVPPKPVVWTDPSLAITATSLGRVQVGMTLDQSQTAAGIVFNMEGDGVHYSTHLPNGYADLFVDLGDSGRTFCVGSVTPERGRTVDSITTPEGFRLGDTVAHLKSVYGNRLTHVPEPAHGIEPRDGYVVKEGSGYLAFSDSNGVVW